MPPSASLAAGTPVPSAGPSGRTLVPDFKATYHVQAELAELQPYLNEKRVIKENVCIAGITLQGTRS